MENIKILISRSEIGAGKRGSSLGPDAIKISAIEKNFPLFDNFEVEDIPIEPLKMHHGTQTSLDNLFEFVPLYENSCQKLSEALENYKKTLIFSGDHSNAPGFISAMKDTFPDKKSGVIWIDAHGDIHSPYTTPSGNVHGMPIAVLLSLDNLQNKIRNLDDETTAVWNKMKLTGSMGISPKLTPEELVFIDIRDLEKQEWKIIDDLGIKYFTPEFRKKHGIKKIIEETKKQLADCEIIYVSFDVDSMDASIVQGTGTPVPDGLSVDEAKELLSAFWEMEKCRVLEFTEINPLLDNSNKVAQTVVEILQSVLGDLEE